MRRLRGATGETECCYSHPFQNWVHYVMFSRHGIFKHEAGRMTISLASPLGGHKKFIGEREEGKEKDEVAAR